MYNSEIKCRYIEEKESTTGMTDGYLKRQFDKIEIFERRLDKDLCNFTVYEIIDVYKTLNLISIESLSVLNSHLSLYTQWCLCQNLVSDCQNHYAEMDRETLLGCINTAIFKKTIITRETLYQWMDNLVNPSDAFIMLALFEGISGENYCELANLKMSDFDGNKVKLCTGRELTVSSKLVDLAEKSNRETKYYAVGSAKGRTLNFLDENLIIKNVYNSKSDTPYDKGKRIYHRMKRNFTALGVEKYMKPRALLDSGKIDYINRRSEELGITARDFIFTKEYADEVKSRFGFDLNHFKFNFIDKYKEYLV